MNKELEDTVQKVRAELRELRAESGDELKPMTLDEEKCRELEQFTFAQNKARRKPDSAFDTDDLPVMDFGDDA